MELDADKLLEHAIRDGIREAVKARLASGYNSPMEKLIDGVIAKNSGAFTDLLHESMTSALTDNGFRDEIKAGLRHSLAKILVQRFGGELEKQVNTLKSDPETRARITAAIDEIVKQKTA